MQTGESVKQLWRQVSFPNGGISIKESYNSDRYKEATCCPARSLSFCYSQQNPSSGQLSFARRKAIRSSGTRLRGEMWIHRIVDIR